MDSYHQNRSTLALPKDASLVGVIVISLNVFLCWHLFFYELQRVTVFFFRVYDFRTRNIAGLTASVWLAGILFLDYWYQCTGIIAANCKGLQTHMGKYTGVEFGPGWYVVVKYPIPFVSMVSQLFGKENPLGWAMEKQIAIETAQKIVELEIRFYTQEMVEVIARVRSCFRITNMTARDLMGESLERMASDRFAQMFRDTIQGKLSYREVLELVVEVKTFNKEYSMVGVQLEQVYIEEVIFTNQSIQNMFQGLLVKGIQEKDLKYKAYEMDILATLMPGLDEQGIAMLYAAFVFSRR